MFQGLSTALSALYAFQQGLDTTGNNIANVNTEGYSRQRVNLHPLEGQTVGSFWSIPPKVGIGVTVDSIMRTRDQFLDARSLQEHSSQGQLARNAQAMSELELIFAEPSDTGLQAQMAQFWSAWDNVNDANLAPRTQIVENAKTLVTSIHDARISLDKMESAAISAMRNDVGQLNAWADQVAGLNANIRTALQAGQQPNALMDQRDLLISKMSDLADVLVSPTEWGSVAVTIGGVPIVRDDRATHLEVDLSGPQAVLRWDKDGDPNVVTNGLVAHVNGGKIAGQLEIANETVPRYIANLDSLVSRLVNLVNTQHQAGEDIDGNAGVPFFSGTTSADVEVTASLAANPRLVAAAKAGGGPLDNENARAMAMLASAQLGPDSFYRDMIDQLGVESQTAANRHRIQRSITQSVDAQRDSVSGVSLDQELTNLVRYQQSYAAAARYVNALNTTMDALLGMVR